MAKTDTTSAGKVARSPLLSSLLHLALLLPWSNAQKTVDAISINPTLLPTPVSPMTVPASPTPTTDSIRSMTTLLTSSSSSNATSSPSSQPSDQTPPDLFPAATSQSDNGEHKEAVFNYYFLFLVLFAVFVATLLWWLHRQQKRRKERTRLSGQHALARDLEGWTSTRRFMHGRYGWNPHLAFVRREEGLDERGEAPPPYHLKGEGTVAHEPVEASQDLAHGVTIPLRALSRVEAERRPPEYRNTLHVDLTESIGRDTTRS